MLFSHDIPGDPLIGPIVHDEPVLALDTVHYAGQAVAMVVGESYEACRAGAEAVRVDYEVLPAITTIDEALAAKSFLTDEHRIARGDLEAALAQADVVIEGRTESGAQDHFYLETQATLATPLENGCMHLLSSTQHPTEVQRMAALVLGKGAHEITCETARMGGAFGGKESQAANYASLAALAAHAVGEPVCVWLNREDDMAFTGKRHPFASRYKAGFSAEGDLTALQVEIYSDGGWTVDLSPGVHDRAMFHLDNAYFIPNLEFTGRACRTNRPSGTAFRGFGGPQGVVVVEEAIARFAEQTGRDPAEVRARNYYAEGGRDWALTDKRLRRSGSSASMKSCWRRAIMGASRADRRLQRRQRARQTRARLPAGQVWDLLYRLGAQPGGGSGRRLHRRLGADQSWRHRDGAGSAHQDGGGGG